ncbi:uncharacterized protein DNG_02930 [Cephalotrichum gorgonifer]|uniref:Nephrocystin 3-like N-terminal domain-containing protein n=1 Tax=Cephalotrichum gorgonifer TaxID=2041049 RepID=A0AAE8MUE5_9PEZI|nr:uncharacterized protein DNG_02930 [Cephalotrichum gorgonifer]
MPGDVVSSSKRSRFRDMLSFRHHRSTSRSRSRSTSRPQGDSSIIDGVLDGDQGSLQPVQDKIKSQNLAAFEDNSHVIKQEHPIVAATASKGSESQVTAVQIKIEPAEGPHDAATVSEQPDSQNVVVVSRAGPDSTGGTVFKAEADDDIWSVAYREAVERLDEDKREIVTKGERIDELFKRLRESDADNADHSLFRKGLSKLQKPLQYVKLAVDLAQPLLALEPAAATATGAVKSFTVVAISVCGANDALTSQITEMLEHTAIIDECDVLGQKLTTENSIYEVLVPVYVDLLEFYIAAFKFFSGRGTALQILSEALKQHLPPIVKNFLQHASRLQDSIQNTTLRLVDEIKRLLLDDKILKLLGVDKERKRSEHHCNIQRAREDGACTWVTQNPTFLEWYGASTSRFLVMFGGMGCGKTVTTAFLIDHVIHLNKYSLPRPLICYHYCNTDENSQAVYIYSSLLLQLLDQQPGLKIRFDKWHTDTRMAKSIDPAQSSKELGIFFAECVEFINRPVFVVIDAMDECDDRSMPEVIALLRDISERTSRLKVFLSSRPDEGIEGILDGAAQIRLLPDRERDVVILDYLVNKNLAGSPERVRKLVISRLGEVADGSAIWMKLTVDLIRRLRINAYARMESFLKEIPLPADLSALYLKLFRQAVDGEDENERIATRALEILAVARRPLSILELGWALAIGDLPEDATKIQDVEDWVDVKRVLDLVQPLLSHIDFDDARKSQVRLAHQSLKVLILRSPPSGWADLKNLERMSEAERTHMGQRQSDLEARLLNVCVRYLLLDEFDNEGTHLFSEDQQEAQALAELPQGFGLFDDDGDDGDDALGREDGETGRLGTSHSDTTESSAPMCFNPAEHGFGEFFVYASCYWLDHFCVTAWESSPHISDIVLLCRAKSNRLRNWADQYCRPDCTVLPKFSWNSDTLDPLVITSTFGPTAAVEKILSDYDLGGPDFLSTSIATTIKHLVSHGRASMLRSIFSHERIGLTPQTLPLFMGAMGAWTTADVETRDEDGWTGFFDLVHEMTSLLVTDSWGNELLCEAARSGCLPVIKRLFDDAERNPELRTELLRDRLRQIDPKRRDRHQSIGEAVRSNHVDVVRYLLQQTGIETHLRHRDAGGANVFCMAARYGNPEVVQLLIEHYPEGVDELDENDDAPLREFAFAGSSAESVGILLTLGGADVNGGPMVDGWSALRIAVRKGSIEVCRTLVEVGGADPREALRLNEEGHVVGLADADSINDEEMRQAMLDMFCQIGGLELASS